MSDSSPTRRARRDGTAEGQRESTSTPHFLGGLYDEAELGDRVVDIVRDARQLITALTAYRRALATIALRRRFRLS